MGLVIKTFAVGKPSALCRFFKKKTSKMFKVCATINANPMYIFPVK